jgi:hypothetical protein
MAANATFQQGYGLDTVLVVASCKADASVIRDGKTDIVSSAANGSTGVYTFTLAKKFPQCVHAVASVQNYDGSSTDLTARWDYNATTGVFTVYTLAAAVATAPEASDRVGFIAVFCTKDSLKDS